MASTHFARAAALQNEFRTINTVNLTAVTEKPASAYAAAVSEYLSTLARHHGDDPKILQAAEASIATVQDPEVRKYLAARIDEVRVTCFGRPTQ